MNVTTKRAADQERLVDKMEKEGIESGGRQREAWNPWDQRKAPKE